MACICTPVEQHCANLPKIYLNLRTKVDADWLFPSSFEAGKCKPRNTCQQKLCCILAVGNLLSGIWQTIFEHGWTRSGYNRFADLWWKTLFWTQAGPVATDYWEELELKAVQIISALNWPRNTPHPHLSPPPSDPISGNFSKGLLGLLLGCFFMPRLGTHRRWRKIM